MLRAPLSTSSASRSGGGGMHCPLWALACCSCDCNCKTDHYCCRCLHISFHNIYAFLVVNPCEQLLAITRCDMLILVYSRFPVYTAGTWWLCLRSICNKSTSIFRSPTIQKLKRGNNLILYKLKKNIFDKNISEIYIGFINWITMTRKSSRGDHGMHCWWDLIRPKQLSSGSLCQMQC